MKVLIVGYGNIGKTFANSFISSRFIKPEDIFVLVKDKFEVTNEEKLTHQNFIKTFSSKISEFDIVLFSVKPQDFLELSKKIAPFITQNQLVLSVMAGVTIHTISKALNATKIVRSMPNIPTQIGLGMTVFTASQEIDRKDLFIIQNLINTTGKSVYVEDENLINAATAISGSGPAYVFYFMKSIINAAVELGFNQSEAELLVSQTFMGSVALQNNESLSNEEWILKVASKGGTTQSALNIFESQMLENTIIDAIKNANNRAVELGS